MKEATLDKYGSWYGKDCSYWPEDEETLRLLCKVACSSGISSLNKAVGVTALWRVQPVQFEEVVLPPLSIVPELVTILITLSSVTVASAWRWLIRELGGDIWLQLMASCLPRAGHAGRPALCGFSLGKGRYFTGGQWQEKCCWTINGGKNLLWAVKLGAPVRPRPRKSLRSWRNTTILQP